jgi:hypothetical protein
LPNSGPRPPHPRRRGTRVETTRKPGLPGRSTWIGFTFMLARRRVRLRRRGQLRAAGSARSSRTQRANGVPARVRAPLAGSSRECAHRKAIPAADPGKLTAARCSPGPCSPGAHGHARSGPQGGWTGARLGALQPETGPQAVGRADSMGVADQDCAAARQPAASSRAWPGLQQDRRGWPRRCCSWTNRRPAAWSGGGCATPRQPG